MALSRATTLPVTVITLSFRTASAVCENRAGDVDHDLGHAVVVAQVDEQQIAVVALALDPARQTGLLADMLGPQLAARMGSVNGGHHGFSGLNGPAKGTDCPAKSRDWALSVRGNFAVGRLARYRAVSMKLITTTDDLAAFCKPLADAEFIAVDTEFMRERTYWPKLCLAQVAGPEEAAAIDALADGIDLAPLDELMANPKVLKVFHAARQDLEIFYLRMNKVPAPLFDTQVAAMVCGHGEAASYESLATKLAKARIDKSSRFTDWSRRPLSERQITYAISDVTHLRVVYENLRRQLEKTGRLELDHRGDGGAERPRRPTAPIPSRRGGG